MSEKKPAKTDPVAAVAIGEKAEVAHAVEAGGKDMKEKSADELVRMKAHNLLTVTTIAPIVLPSEGDMAVIDLNEAAVGDGDAVCISAEIGKHLVRAAEWRLCLDDPFDAARTCEVAGEGLVIVEIRQLVEETEFAASKGILESGQKESPEQP